MAGKWPEFTVESVTPELVATLVKHIEKGSTPQGAARIMGIPASRFRRWRQIGTDQIDDAYEEQDRALALEPEAMLVLAVEQATAAYAQKLGKRVAVGGDDWRAKAWLLERLERDDFQPTERVDVNIGGTGEPILIEGRAVVGLGNVLEFVRQIGQPHLLDALDAGDSRPGLPAAGDLLSDPAERERAAGDVPAADET